MFKLQELLQLEEDVKLLEEMYPQGEKVIILTPLLALKQNHYFTINVLLCHFRLRQPGL
jgi:hypothetical protein